MSRYTLPGKTPNLTVTVGFDRPMECYFFQLWDRNKDDDEPVINIDTRRNYEILELLEQHADYTYVLTKKIHEAISGDFDPEIWLDMDHTRFETEVAVKQMFDLTGMKLPSLKRYKD